MESFFYVFHKGKVYLNSLTCCGGTNPQHVVEQASYFSITIFRVAVDSGVIN